MARPASRLARLIAATRLEVGAVARRRGSSAAATYRQASRPTATESGLPFVHDRAADRLGERVDAGLRGRRRAAGRRVSSGSTSAYCARMCGEARPTLRPGRPCRSCTAPPETSEPGARRRRDRHERQRGSARSRSRRRRSARAGRPARRRAARPSRGRAPSRRRSRRARRGSSRRDLARRPPRPASNVGSPGGLMWRCSATPRASQAASAAGDAGDRGDRLLEQHERARRAEPFEDAGELGGAAVAEADAHGQVRAGTARARRSEGGMRHFAYSVDARLADHGDLDLARDTRGCPRSRARSGATAARPRRRRSRSASTITRTSRPACIA